MEARAVQRNHRFIYSAATATIGACALVSSFMHSLYGKPAQVVVLATTLCMWSLLLVFSSRFAQLTVARVISIVLSSAVVWIMISAASNSSENIVFAIAFVCASIVICVSALQHEQTLAYVGLGCAIGFVSLGMIITGVMGNFPLACFLSLGLMGLEFTLVRRTHIPIVASLNEALERAEIFSTITRSSREFHSREPEEAIRNIVNVTKTLGYISVSVVSFDRRQKIFEDGVPIPNVMDIAVRASATRRVTITQDEHPQKRTRSRQGDIVGVPIWINGRYSAALIVQTSSATKVTQRDCEALELLADQAGRALENAGKAAMDRRVVERLTDESQRDKLTGLGNRRFADLMVASMKVGDVLAMVDLDGLKTTNDQYGHGVGDELLHEVGVFLNEQIRNPDMSARLGGDEFMILLRTADDGAPAILERLLMLWRRKNIYGTTFSIGMAIHRHDKTTRETVEAADDALYDAKKAGKDRLVCANNTNQAGASNA